MREDEISRYTADGDVLDMMDFRDIPADELAGTEDYIDAQATVAEGIHDALRAAGAHWLTACSSKWNRWTGRRWRHAD